MENRTARICMGILLAAVVASFLVVTFASSAKAGLLAYWARGGSTYICKGTESGVICNETNWRPRYDIAILKGSIVVTYRKQVIFGCDRGFSPAGNCEYYGP